MSIYFLSSCCKFGIADIDMTCAGEMGALSVSACCTHALFSGEFRQF